MPSRLVARLAERIAAETDPVRRACLRAQLAIQLARQGRRDEAGAIVRAIREEFASRPNGEVTAWVSLAEALDSFYTHPGPQAQDRLKRAHALSRAMAHPVLEPLCAAWLAHMAFNDNRMHDMVGHAQETLRLAQPEHHAAMARVCLVIADAFHYAGRFDLARPWYGAVREHALAEGDDATISAMLHNVAALRANQVHLADAFGDSLPLELDRARLETESTWNYDIGIGTKSLQTLVPLVRAQLLSSQRKHEEAVPLLDSALDSDHPENLKRREASFYAERAWCNVMLGNMQRAVADAYAASKAIAAAVDLDDLAATNARLAAVYGALGRVTETGLYTARASEYLQRHRSSQQELLVFLSGIRLPPMHQLPSA